MPKKQIKRCRGMISCPNQWIMTIGHSMGPSSTEGQFSHYWPYRILQLRKPAIPRLIVLPSPVAAGAPPHQIAMINHDEACVAFFTLYSLYFVISGEIFGFTPVVFTFSSVNCYISVRNGFRPAL